MTTNSNNPWDSSSSVRKASEDMLDSAGKTLESTREHANSALAKAETKVRELRGSVDPVVEMLTSKAQKMAQQSLDLASEARERAEKSLKNAADATTRYVSEQPMRSVLMAAAVGAAVALLVAASRNRDHNRY